MQMKNKASRVFMAATPLCLSLAFGLVACGGSDEGGNKSTGGSSSMSSGGSANNGGSANTAAGTGNTAAGTGNTAGNSSNNGGSANNGGGFDSGLPNDKPLGSLTPAEGQALCDKLDTYFSSGTIGMDLQDFNCRVAGLLAGAFSQPKTDAELQTACKGGYDSCKKAPPETETEECTPPGATCTATAAELEACMADSVAYLKQVEGTIPSCAEITLADLQAMEMPEQPDEPASCTTLDMKCPDAPALPGTGATP